MTPGGGARGGVRIVAPANAGGAGAALRKLRDAQIERESLRAEAIEVALRLRFHQRRRDDAATRGATAYLGPRDRRRAAQSARTIATLETRRLAIQQRLMTIDQTLRVQRVRFQQQQAPRRAAN